MIKALKFLLNLSDNLRKFLLLGRYKPDKEGVYFS